MAPEGTDAARKFADATYDTAIEIITEYEDYCGRVFNSRRRRVELLIAYTDACALALTARDAARSAGVDVDAFPDDRKRGYAGMEAHVEGFARIPRSEWPKYMD